MDLAVNSIGYTTRMNMPDMQFEQSQYTPEQVWQIALAHLQLQMPRATFETWLKDTWLCFVDNGTWHVTVKNEFAKDWLENRLFKVINRVIVNIVGRPVDLCFVIEENPIPVGAGIPDEDSTPTHSLPKSPPGEQEDCGLAVDVRRLNKTGYQPLTNYFPLFIEPYLHHKWGTTGQKAYSLWEKLTALDGQRLLSNHYCNWTRPVEYRLKELAGLLAKTSSQDVTGQYGYCWQVNEAKKQGEPLATCCGQYQPDCQFRDGRHCRHWLTGILEVLSDEGVLMIEEYGGRKNYHLKLQLWRSWPILTPSQVNNVLSAALRSKHKEWLLQHSSTLNLTLERWAAETNYSAIDQFLDRNQGQKCRHRFQRNPFRL